MRYQGPFYICSYKKCQSVWFHSDSKSRPVTMAEYHDCMTFINWINHYLDKCSANEKVVRQVLNRVWLGKLKRVSIFRFVRVIFSKYLHQDFVI